MGEMNDLEEDEEQDEEEEKEEEEEEWWALAVELEEDIDEGGYVSEAEEEVEIVGGILDLNGGMHGKGR